ncbi:MAG: hypothetical protein NT123_12195 [Proteobacteria bacterium]|nr:hypothetical protein [Pseudomonadota bacterium]
MFVFDGPAFPRRLACAVLVAVCANALAQAPSQAEKLNMELVGHHDLQGRSAYQPVVHAQGGRWIAYIGLHGGTQLNTLTRQNEASGTAILDVSDPKQPRLLAHIPGSPGGGAQMVRVCNGSELPRADKNKVYLLRPYGNSAQEVWDVTDPAAPRLVSKVAAGLQGTHKNWWDYGTSSYGILQIVDRKKLLQGPKEPTTENLLYPQVGRLDLGPDAGAHTAFPLLGMGGAGEKSRDYVVVTAESLADACREPRQKAWFVDVGDEVRPRIAANWTVDEASGNFCARSGRFGTHSSNESFAPVYYRRVVFFAHFNAGVRAVDVRDPLHPREAAYYVPESNANAGGAILTNNVEVDDRGYVYITDRAGNGLHILELTGPARAIAAFK